MNRFQARPRLADLIGGWLHSACGLVGCTALAGIVSLGTAAAEAATRPDPEPRSSEPPVCRYALSARDRHIAHRCEEAWPWRDEGAGDRPEHRRDLPRWKSRYHWKRGERRHFHRRHWHRNQAAPHAIEPDAPSRESPSPSLRPAAPGPAAPKATRSPGRASSPKPSSSPEATPTASEQPPPDRPTRFREQADETGPRPPALQPVLLLGLLIPAAAAICYPFRRRIYAAATTGPVGLPVADAEPRPAGFGHRPVLDPFTAQVTGLSGPGAVSAARMLALTALAEHGDDSLVVLPRPDATALFGLAEDELLDDDAAGLFIPGNLDAALAYLETELAIRRNTGVAHARRHLLVADCAAEAGRIKELLAQHPDAVSAVLLGPWTGDRATIDGDGRVEAPAALASALPQPLPAMSRTEARDRLLAALARQKKSQRPRTRRRSSPRRP